MIAGIVEAHVFLAEGKPACALRAADPKKQVALLPQKVISQSRNFLMDKVFNAMVHASDRYPGFFRRGERRLVRDSVSGCGDGVT